MGQAPATGRNSLRTVPRNFPGRSGTKEDSVFLCSPETATASALYGLITDPRKLDFPYPKIELPQERIVNREILSSPLPLEEAKQVELVKGPNIVPLPGLDPLPDTLVVPILLKAGDDISTDGILPAGARVLPYRSNIPEISQFAFELVDPTYPRRAKALPGSSDHAIIAGSNYGQGSSREHAALAPRYLGLRLVIAKSFARIHQQNLVNFGVLPVTFDDPTLYDHLEEGDMLRIADIRQQLARSPQDFRLKALIDGKDFVFTVSHALSKREIDVLLAGGITNWIRERDK
jgi:aconitate hydratase